MQVSATLRQQYSCRKRRAGSKNLHCDCIYKNKRKKGYTIFCLSAWVLARPLAPAPRFAQPQAQGQIMVWGKKAEYITASYTNARGDKSSSLLLCTGWWGVARHFHYLPEITGAFFWTLPALFENCAPYFYVVFLILLLTDRAFRDDARCGAKYGKHWDKVTLSGGGGAWPASELYSLSLLSNFCSQYQKKLSRLCVHLSNLRPLNQLEPGRRVALLSVVLRRAA